MQDLLVHLYFARIFVQHYATLYDLTSIYMILYLTEQLYNNIQLWRHSSVLFYVLKLLYISQNKLQFKHWRRSGEKKVIFFLSAALLLMIGGDEDKAMRKEKRRGWNSSIKHRKHKKRPFKNPSAALRQRLQLGLF